MVQCIVIGCNNRPSKASPRSFHTVPSVIKHQGDEAMHLSMERRRCWLAAINRPVDVIDKLTTPVVCSDHFVNNKSAKLFERSNVDWVPTLNLGYGDDVVVEEKVKSATERANRRMERKRKMDDSSFLDSSCSNLDESSNHDESYLSTASPPPPVLDHQYQLQDSIKELCLSPVVDFTTSTSSANVMVATHMSVGVQTDLLAKDIDRMQNSIESLTVKLIKLQIATCKVGVEGWFDTDGKVTFYTGLPTIESMMILFEFVSSGIAHHERSALTQFQEFAMTLMRVRLNLKLQDLADRYNIST